MNNVQEVGQRPYLVHEDVLCGTCSDYHDFEMCPECGSMISIGLGLAFGGFGLYKYCNDDFSNHCKWFWKREFEE